MEQLLITYGNTLGPALLALALVIVMGKIVIAIEHAIIRLATSLLTIIVLSTGLVTGFSVVGRAGALQKVVTAAMQGSAVFDGGRPGTITAAALTHTLDRSARHALVEVGRLRQV